MSYNFVEEQIRTAYDQVATRYRQDDEQEVKTADHAHLKKVLEELSSSFGRPISVLDVGCGTGRYFYCLRNVQKLVGIDVSREMLEGARDPVNPKDVTVETTLLINESFYSAKFPSESFDFIYSLGVFGNGCSVTEDLCAKFYAWLKPDGILFFDTFDIAGEPIAFRVQQRSRELIRKLMPPGMIEKWMHSSASVPFFIPSKKSLQKLVSKVFPDVQICSRKCRIISGEGRKLECIARKVPGHCVRSCT